MYNYRAEMTGTGSRSFAQSVFFLLQQLQSYEIYTVSQKKVPTFKLRATLSNLNQFSKFLHCWKAYEICYKTDAIIFTTP